MWCMTIWVTAGINGCMGLLNSSIVLPCKTVYILQPIWSALGVNLDCFLSLQWRHNGRDSVSNQQPHDCLLKRLFRRRSKKTSKLRVTGLCAGNSPGNSPHKWPVTRKMFLFDDVIMFFYLSPLGDMLESRQDHASNAENVSIWWRHHVLLPLSFRGYAWIPARSRGIKGGERKCCVYFAGVCLHGKTQIGAGWHNRHSRWCHPPPDVRCRGVMYRASPEGTL